ncbi:MAG: hypothetical protein U9R72_03505 [Chloroflexota bacterium]|nr:hypothetical protein [Chloroflexota bacterium]
MIDVWGVVANGLWVLGLAVVLAGLSWAHWLATVEGARFRDVLGRTGMRRVTDGGLALFCTGVAATSRVWWQRGLWALLALAWVVDGAVASHSSDTAGDDVS